VQSNRNGCPKEKLYRKVVPDERGQPEEIQWNITK